MRLLSYINNVLAALDILVKDEEGWKAYEVKSSTKVSETYIKDASNPILYHYKFWS